MEPANVGRPGGQLSGQQYYSFIREPSPPPVIRAGLVSAGGKSVFVTAADRSFQGGHCAQNT